MASFNFSKSFFPVIFQFKTFESMYVEVTQASNKSGEKLSIVNSKECLPYIENILPNSLETSHYEISSSTRTTDKRWLNP